MCTAAGLLFLVTCGGGGSGGADAASIGDGRAAPDAPAGTGYIVYTLGGDGWRIDAAPGSTPVDLGADDWIAASPDGAHRLESTTRHGCDSWACVVLDGVPVMVAGNLLHLERGAISSDGNLLVFPSTDLTASGHSEDLIAYTRASASAAWQTPSVLTSASTHPYHHLPVLSADGKRVLFDCSADAYSTASTSICEVGVDGQGFREVVTPADHAGNGLALHHPAYAPDGAIVFEGDWQGEQIWRRAGTDAPADLSGSDADDNSPCVLPDGRIASIWLGRAGGPSTHELKLMQADGSSPVMLLTDVDVSDVGIGCY